MVHHDHFVPDSFQFLPVSSSLLPVYFQSTSSLLPVYFQSTSSLFSSLLLVIFPGYFQSTSSLLPVYFQFSSRLQPTSKSIFLCKFFDFLWIDYKLIRYTVCTNNNEIIDYPLCTVEKTKNIKQIERKSVNYLKIWLNGNLQL